MFQEVDTRDSKPGLTPPGSPLTAVLVVDTPSLWPGLGKGRRGPVEGTNPCLLRVCQSCPGAVSLCRQQWLPTRDRGIFTDEDAPVTPGMKAASQERPRGQHLDTLKSTFTLKTRNFYNAEVMLSDSQTNSDKSTLTLKFSLSCEQP